MKKNIYLVIYLILIFINACCANLSNSLNVIAKSLLMPTLMLYVFQFKKQNNIILLVSLFFAWLGDIFLLYSNNIIFFSLGLSVFFIAHLCYIYIFLQDFSYRNYNCDRLMNFVRTLVLLLAIIFYIFIYKYLALMVIPSTLYMIALIIMFLSSSFRNKRYSTYSYQLVVIGSLLFLLSDSILAISKFYQSFYLDNTVIILTYMIAQLLIIIGIINAKIGDNL